MAKPVNVTDLETKATELGTRVTAAEARVKELEAEKAEYVAAGGGRASYPVHGRTSDEERAMRAFGCSHVKELMSVNVGHENFLHVPEELKGIVLKAKRDVTTARFIGQLFHGDPTDSFGNEPGADKIARVKSMTESHFGRDVLAPRLKSFGSTVSGGGAEFVPTLFANAFIDEFVLEKKLLQFFGEIKMPSNPYKYPVLKAGTKARISTEGVQATSAQATTANIVFSATKFEEFYPIPEELNEDSAVDILPLGQQACIKAHIKAIEAACMNGDTSGTHQDSDTAAGSATLAEKAWKGLRKLALANSAAGVTISASNAVVTEALLNQLQASLGIFGTNPDELVWIFTPKTYVRALTLPSFITMEKAGPRATNMTGVLGILFGIPVVVSQYGRDDLNASGVYDGTTTTRSAVMLANRTRFYRGIRRPIMLRLAQDVPSYDRYQIASFSRNDFEPVLTQAATETAVAILYNLAY